MTRTTDLELDTHLRRTLAAVAASVQEEAPVGSAPIPPRTRRRRHWVVGAGAAIAVVPLAAAAIVRFGPEYVDEIPPANPIISGDLDGDRYWVVDGRDLPGCEGHPSGIEIIVEKHNVVGQEWNTSIASFGEPTAAGCAPLTATEPAARTHHYDGGQRVGDGMLWVGALHPDVDQVRAALDGDTPFGVDTFDHEGAAYYVLEVPAGTTTFTVDYLVDGDVLPHPAGEPTEHTVAP